MGFGLVAGLRGDSEEGELIETAGTHLGAIRPEELVGGRCPVPGEGSWERCIPKRR